MLIWAWALQQTVTRQFELHRWDQPSLLFARPLQLYQGMPMTTQQLEFELQAAGYMRQQGQRLQPGQYASDGALWRARSRNFLFADGEQASALVQIRFSADQISELRVDERAWISFALIPPRSVPSVRPVLMIANLSH